jgi:catechol 2,3-dioxygenase-like lactoylglutathione lyase family enzyme
VINFHNLEEGLLMKHLSLVLLLAVVGWGVPNMLGGDDGIGIQAVGHVAVPISAVQPALHFYVDQLGLKEAFRMNLPDGTVHLIYLRAGNSDTFVELDPGRKATQPQSYHFGLVVKDLQATLRALKARGYPLPADAFEQAAKVTPDKTHYVLVKDPDGNGVELCQILPDTFQHKSGAVINLGKP